MSTSRQVTPGYPAPSNIFPFDNFLQGHGLTRMTGYRYRQLGVIKTVNIFGRLYISRAEIEEFERRALNGEFNKAAKVPSRKGAGDEA